MPSLHPRRSSKNYFEDKAKYLRWSEKTKYFHCNNGTKKELARSRGVRTKWDITTIIIGNSLVCENIKKKSLPGGVGERILYCCLLSLTKNGSSENSNAKSCIIGKSPFSLKHVPTPLRYEHPEKQESRKIDAGGDKN